MIIDFSRFDMKERAVMILKNANSRTIGVLGYAQRIELDLRYNETSTIEFELPAFVDGEPVPYYESVTGMTIIELKNVGQFVLMNPKETGDGVAKSKACKGYSLEYEFTYKKLTLAEGTYNFYDPTDKEDTLLGIILERMPSWSLGSIDDSLIGKYRTFEVSGENLYNFIKGTAQESYGCLFDFDTIQRQIHVRDAARDAETTPVFISTHNLTTQIEIEENTQDIVTRLDVSGAEGVSIRDVNPCGTNKIIDLGYFMTEANFSRTIIDKYAAWEKTVRDSRTGYYTESIEYSALTMRRATQAARLTDLQGELSSLENIQAVTIQAMAQGLKTQSDLNKANADIEAKKNEIAAERSAIDSLDTQITQSMNRLKAIQKACSFEGYFTDEERRQMDKYIKDDEISESSFALVEKGSYGDEGTGKAVNGAALSITRANITQIKSASGKDIYDITGGTLELGDLISGTLISAIAERGEDNSLTATAYLSRGTYSGNAFDNACLSITGNITSLQGDLQADESGAQRGKALSVQIGSGYSYFTFDISEYQKRSVAWELYQYGEEILKKLARPSYTFDITSANFFTGADFEAFRRKVALGRKIYTELDEGTILKPICIAIKLKYESPDSLEVQFSDSYTSGESTFRLVDLLDQSVSMGKNLDASKYIYSSFVDSGAKGGIREFMTSALDVAKNAIMTSGEQAITWDAAGLRLRRYANEAHTDYEPEQIWMINNSIVMTADNWATAQMAIGKFHDENLGDCWGIVAPRVVGTLLAGNELVIESAKKEGGVSVFRVDGNGVRLHNGDMSITGNNTHIALNPALGIAIGQYPVYSQNGSTYTINENNAKFWADTQGNLHYKGTLHAANGEFTGSVTATSLTIVGGGGGVSIGDYVAGHDSVTGAATAAGNAQSTADQAQSAANSAQSAAGKAQSTADGAANSANSAMNKANEANTAAGNAMNKANEASSSAAYALEAANSASSAANSARSFADSIYNGATGIYFTNSSVGTVQISGSVGIKVIGTDNSYFSARNNAMGFFKSDGTAMLYYENGNMVLRGVLAAAGSYIGGTNGWVVGADCMYNNSASYLGASGGIYMGTGGISVGSAIVMKPNGTFIIRGDNQSSASGNYVFKIEPETASGETTYKMRIGANVQFDDSFVLPVEHGGTGGADGAAMGRLSGLYRATSVSAMNAISGATNGDLCALYSEGNSGATVSGAITTTPSTSPGYLAIGAYDASGHRDTIYFGLDIPYWNIAGLSGESVDSAYARCGVGSSVSGGAGLFMPVYITVSNSSTGVSSLTMNFTLNTRPSGCSRALTSEWTSGMNVRLYRSESGGAYTQIASTLYQMPDSFKNNTNADRATSVTLSCSTPVTSGEYYIVFFNQSAKSLFWIRPASLSIPQTSIGAAAGLYLKTGGSWKLLSSAA